MRNGIVLVILLTLITAILSDAVAGCEDLAGCDVSACVTVANVDTSASDSEHQDQDSSHHCPIHCTHALFLLKAIPAIAIHQIKSTQISTYQFFIPVTHNDGPFRPPLA